MSVVLALLGWILVAVIGLIVLFAVLPLHLELLLTKEEAVRFSAALRPFGRFGPRIALSGRKKSAAKEEPKEPQAREKKSSRRKALAKNPRQIAGAAVRLVTDLIGCVEIRSASVDGRFGLGDPAETGQVFGLMSPLLYAAPAWPPLRVNIEPMFDRAVLSGRMALDLSLTPVTLLAPLVRFGWALKGPVR